MNVDPSAGAQQVDIVAAQGNGGQKIYLVPQYDLVAVFTGGGCNAESTPPNTIMAKIIVPALIEAASRGKVSSPRKISCAAPGRLPEFRSNHRPGNHLLTTFIYRTVPCESTASSWRQFAPRGDSIVDAGGELTRHEIRGPRERERRVPASSVPFAQDAIGKRTP